MQGAVKDATGAFIPGAEVHVASPSLVGGKLTQTDSKGNYRFTNLPPGPYVLTVKAQGFTALRREGLVIEVGHLPTVDLILTVGAETTVVEVSTESPQIDVTTTTTQTNITSDVINYVPRGTSFQSVIQFAPSARNEPLMGNTTTNGSGSVSPGNGSNGGSFGYSVAGGSDSENAYLVEGQETANLIGGYSHTNVPFDFIQEVQVKTSGIEAEHGGALGGVVNVIMKKGSSNYHGSVFAQFENSAMDSSPNPFPRYDPTSNPTSNPTSWGLADQAYQSYLPKQDHTSDLLPGFTFGGPLLPFLPKMKDRIYFFTGFNPEMSRRERTLDYTGTGLGGVLPFSQNTNTYYTNARIDARATSKIHVFASWLYQLQRQNGENLPLYADSVNTGFVNPAINQAPGNYAHSLGYVAPNQTLNTGADITITPTIVSTTRFGYYFENYHDFGYPRNGVVDVFQTSGLPSDGATDASGTAALPTSLQQGAGYQNGPLANITAYNSNKAIQLDQDFAWFKSGWAGTHNFKFGYQLNRLSNYISQIYNEPYVQVNVGDTAYIAQTPTGKGNCATVQAATQALNPGVSGIGCQGQYGYAVVYDFGTGGKAVNYNHGLFAQDSWTIGHGVTIDAGIRFDKEFLPGEGTGGGAPANPIDFSWGDKIAPRLGGAWDVFQNGKMKVFGSYGVFYDTMKLNLAISSFGGQYWQNCTYALNTSDLGSINVAYNSANRYCAGNSASSQANFAGGSTPSGLTFIENVNNRAFPTTCPTCSSTQEGVAPNLKPYRQHESVAGVDYQLTSTLAFEARYDRRRLDNVIEDSSIYNPSVGETFVVVNPGQGVNGTFSSFCNFLYPTSAGFTQCISQTNPPNQTIPAARSYDGLELRLNKAVSNHWFGMFSYTYSHFRGNYTGLTSSDLSDGGYGGRNAPNNSRAFDEPYFSYNSMGGSSSGLLPTDRPNALKGYAYYQLGFLKKFTTDFGIFQTVYQGTPNSTYIQGVGLPAAYDFPVYVFNRGKWADVSQDPNTGAITLGNPRTYRNPWYIQSDFNIQQSYKIGEAKAVSVGATFTNLFEQRAVLQKYEQLDSNSNYLNQAQFLSVGGLATPDGVPFYAAVEHPYNVSALLNSNPYSVNAGGPQTINSQYGKPLYYQQPRTIRLQAKFTF